MCDCLVAVRFQQPWLQENLWSTKMPRSLLQSLLLRPVAKQAPPTLEFFRTCIYLGSFPFVAFVPTSCFTETILNHKSLIHLWANLPSFVFSMYLFSFLSVCSSKLLILKEFYHMSLLTSFLGCYWSTNRCSLGITNQPAVTPLHLQPARFHFTMLSVWIFGGILWNIWWISVLKDSCPPFRK